MQAGDVIVFSTALLHAAAPWTLTDRPRLNVFQRFQLSAYFGLGEKSTNFVGSGYPLESHKHRLSPAAYELEQPVSYIYLSIYLSGLSAYHNSAKYSAPTM